MLINTCRGPVVNEADLISALQTGEIAAAGIDVTVRFYIDLPDFHRFPIVCRLIWVNSDRKRSL